jgi:hypothetical protein
MRLRVDGEPHQLKYAKAAAKQAGVAPTFILDFIHVLEYLWKAAYCFTVPGSEAAETATLFGGVAGAAAGCRGGDWVLRLSTQDYAFPEWTEDALFFRVLQDV